jgi:hypothetical protein
MIVKSVMRRGGFSQIFFLYLAFIAVYQFVCASLNTGITVVYWSSSLNQAVSAKEM